MWQRIQTLYLGISLGLVISLFFSVVATVSGEGGESVDIYFHERASYLIFCGMLLTGTVGALASFKVRLLQMRVAVIVALIAVGFQVWLGVDFFMHHDEMMFRVPVVFPTVCAILDFLAARGAMLDEAMVQSSSRIRNARKKKR
ncbi:MAG: DUF4293 domain-containing protein [Bacteroidales bacterium]|nr:DUF4293 domain-containing protein [Bacteroidales bacterium]